MKHFLFAAVLILLPVTVNARQLVPAMFAQKYYELRKAGLTPDKAIKLAITYAYVGEGQSHIIIVEGKKYNSDVYAATELSLKQCKEY